jgi:hypothetical protein
VVKSILQWLSLGEPQLEETPRSKIYFTKSIYFTQIDALVAGLEADASHNWYFFLYFFCEYFFVTGREVLCTHG